MFRGCAIGGACRTPLNAERETSADAAHTAKFGVSADDDDAPSGDKVHTAWDIVVSFACSGRWRRCCGIHIWIFLFENAGGATFAGSVFPWAHDSWTRFRDSRLDVSASATCI
jgi:hypothetical protein